MEPPSTSTVSVLNRTSLEAPVAAIQRGVVAALAMRQAAGDVCVLLTDDEGIQALNERFRGLDEPTDVLSFPAGDHPGEQRPLGDIAISIDHARRQAAARGASVDDELAILAIHGALHLAGLDDETEADQYRMRAAMQAAAASAGISYDAAWRTIGRAEIKAAR
ncbi:MAG: rRNA maturation RNase YbeY [Fimbriimonas ginsengisoli]|uniref:Endoribonuclease YbeY n=1 Tax=Fimbriimonas ginsengisoli TaxID=1005039 RepID=A0A931M098_FIMGI|nr:rRNA maturation RNase YbeY [Fimbriimonas ginsengisoli]MBI3720993.1 rRNA maturation RNase YbeY [Fimbriimonas ginsengisoli]